MQIRDDLRNVAIIAHVDHGKTTMVDQLLRQSGIFRANEQVEDRVMDSNDLEKERGITILAKNTAVYYKDMKINIVDTPGHADFGGEVERILMMVDGVLLLVDAFEGSMPQTRFVLKKALESKKKVVVVVNKLDRPEARPQEVIDEVIDLFIELGADDEQLDFPVVFASAREGYATMDPEKEASDLSVLFDLIRKEIPAPNVDVDGPLQILFSSLDYDDFVGRIGIGRIERGRVKSGQNVVLCNKKGEEKRARISNLYGFRGLKRVEIESAEAGDLVCVSGIKGLNIGDTACDVSNIEPLDFIKIDEPTVTMTFLVNDSPIAGNDGKYVTSRNLRDRLYKEVETNVSLKVAETDSTDSFLVSGRGELHFSILIEQMRRQGYEFAVSRPKVIYKTIDDKLYEPIERLVIDVPEDYIGAVMNKMGTRKAEMINMGATTNGTSRLEYRIPVRGLMGYRSEFLTDTKGLGIMNQRSDGYDPYKGDIDSKSNGSLIAHEAGMSITYGLYNAQERGELFIGAGIEVYAGMIVGRTPKNEDLVVNVCKRKQATNVRSSGTDDALRLIPPANLSLEQCLEFISDDELVEVTPSNIRMRKRILDKTLRDKASKRAKTA